MKIMETKPKNQDFVMLPRSIKDAYAEDKINFNEYVVIIWIWQNTNPVKGCFLTCPQSLMQDFPDRFSYETMRQILSNLRRSQWIYYEDRKGKKGSFNIYPVNFQRTNKFIQTWDYLQGVAELESVIQPKHQSEPEVNHVSECPNHISEDQNSKANKQLFINPEMPKITIPYNDNDDEKDIENIGDTSLAFKERTATPKSTTPIPVDTYVPKTKDELICQDTARWLGERDMRPILKLLNQYKIFYIEKAWGIMRVDCKKEIGNKGAYFTTLVRKLYEDDHK